MEERNAKILTAAYSVFSRYGVSKTTMNDIAKEAHVARQTLYNAYAGKEEVLRATVQFISEQGLQSVTQAWQQAASLDEKFDIYFRECPVAWYDTVESSPNSADLLDGLHNIAHEELEIVAKRWVLAWTQLLETSLPHLDNSSPNASQLADFIHSTSISAKSSAPDKQALVQRLEIMKASVLALTN